MGRGARQAQRGGTRWPQQHTDIYIEQEWSALPEYIYKIPQIYIFPTHDVIPLVLRKNVHDIRGGASPRDYRATPLSVPRTTYLRAAFKCSDNSSKARLFKSTAYCVPALCVARPHRRVTITAEYRYDTSGTEGEHWRAQTSPAAAGAGTAAAYICCSSWRWSCLQRPSSTVGPITLLLAPPLVLQPRRRRRRVWFAHGWGWLRGSGRTARITRRIAPTTPERSA